MHDAVCNDIVLQSLLSTYGRLYKTNVKIIGIPLKQYGLADIRSENGMVWEVKRVTCSPNSSLQQLQEYIAGIWIDKNEDFRQKKLTQGDDRPIAGIVLTVPGYIGYYSNVGNGIILYDYIKLPNEKEHATESELEAEQNALKQSVASSKPAFNPASSATLLATSLLSSALLALVSSIGGGGSKAKRIAIP